MVWSKNELRMGCRQTIDREKVISAVESCFDYWLEQHRCLHPLELENVREFKADALALLKEQEAVESDTDSEGTWYCGACGETVGYFPVGCSAPQKFYNFCPECGREVKWE